jgi:hypothetical protein
MIESNARATQKLESYRIAAGLSIFIAVPDVLVAPDCASFFGQQRMYCGLPWA